MKEEELEAAPAALEMTHADAEAIVLANEAEDQHRNKFKRIYYSAWSQIILVSFVAFCLPGMYNALSGLGGGGNVDPHIAAKSSVALTATSAASYLIVCVPVFELIGVRAGGLGGWTYALYSGSLLNFAQHPASGGAFVVASGALLGLGSAFFWLVQGAIMVSYPLPHQKGRAIAVFWIIFNLGGMIGGFISFAQNYHKDTGGTISSSTYWAFIAIMLVGAILSLLLAPPWKVRRSDGSRAGHNPALNVYQENFHQKFVRIVKREILSVLAIRHEKRVFFLLPMFFAANWFYAYQQNLVNGLSFDLDGRGLNSSLYWMAQMIGAFIMGSICDMPWFSRPKRAIIAWVFLFITGNAIMGAGLAFENERERHLPQWIVFQSAEYAPGAVLYFFYGMYDSFWQSLSYWLLGAMCSTPELAGKLVAVYKVTQSIGSAIANQLVTDNVSSRKQFISNWAVIAGCLLVALPAIFRITEPTEEEAAGGMTEGEKTDMIADDFRKTEKEERYASP